MRLLFLAQIYGFAIRMDGSIFPHIENKQKEKFDGNQTVNLPRLQSTGYGVRNNWTLTVGCGGESESTCKRFGFRSGHIFAPTLMLWQCIVWYETLLSRRSTIPKNVHVSFCILRRKNKTHHFPGKVLSLERICMWWVH